MSFPMQGQHSNYKKLEDRPGRRYECYQVDCWLQNKDPRSKGEWERLNKKLKEFAAQKLERK